MFLLGPLYARKIWKRCFDSKTHQISMFSVHTTTDLEQFEKATITPAVVNWGLFSRSFPVHIKTHLKPPVRRAFRKVSFLWRIGVEGRPKCKNKSCVFRFLRPSEDAGPKIVKCWWKTDILVVMNLFCEKENRTRSRLQAKSPKNSIYTCGRQNYP